MKFIPAIFLSISLSFGQMTGREIMERVDAQPEPADVVSVTTMTLVKTVKGKEKKRIREVKQYLKFYEEGDFSSKSLIRFVRPADVKGTGFLMWEYRDAGRDDDQWLYLPALQKVKRIVAKQKREKFMGTDFTYEDLGGRDINRDTYDLLGEETVFEEECYRIKATPLEEDPAYSKRIVWISKERWTVRKVEFYDRKGRLLKILHIPELHRDGDFWTVDRMIMEDVQKAHKTVLVVSDVSYESGMEDSFFTQRFLTRTR